MLLLNCRRPNTGLGLESFAETGRWFRTRGDDVMVSPVLLSRVIMGLPVWNIPFILRVLPRPPTGAEMLRFFKVSVSDSSSPVEGLAMVLAAHPWLLGFRAEEVVIFSNGLYLDMGLNRFGCGAGVSELCVEAFCRKDDLWEVSRESVCPMVP